VSATELKYTSPKRFSLWQRFQLGVLPFSIAASFKGLARLCEWEVRDKHYVWDTVFERGGILCAFWHECLGLAASHHQYTPTVHTLTSYSFDGELAARTVARFGLKSLRGSSSRGGMEALKQLKTAVDLGCFVGWTLDGPRGPRRKAKAGIAYLSAKTGMPIIPNAYAVSKCWRLSSWDRFPIPKPGARIISAFGPPIAPPPDVSSEVLEKTRLEVETALNALHRAIEQELNVVQSL